MSSNTVVVNGPTTASVSTGATTTFKCPVPGCEKTLAMLAGSITSHIKKNHPKISKSMHLVDGRTAIYCRDCDRYATFLHYHCYECENAPDATGVKFFRSREDRDTHLKADHQKWWLEYDCRHKKECHGYHSGACGFNHHEHSDRFIADGADVPSYVCKYDRPWDGIRCKRTHCSYDHFWGRVRALIKKKSTATTVASGSSTMETEDHTRCCATHDEGSHTPAVEETPPATDGATTA